MMIMQSGKERAATCVDHRLRGLRCQLANLGDEPRTNPYLGGPALDLRPPDQQAAQDNPNSASTRDVSAPRAGACPAA
jgi:hypothetical protein